MPSIDRVRILSHDGTERMDSLAVEEPLEIRLRAGGSGPAEAFVTTMRTPGHDDDLAAGLLFAEGILVERGDLLDLARPSDPRIDPELKENVVVASLSDAAFARSSVLKRRTVMGSACGVCGTVLIEDLRRDLAVLRPGPAMNPALLPRLVDRLREGQGVFDRTGGLHAAGLFTPGGDLIYLREDIGRHNAVDKVVGRALLDGRLPFSDAILVVSGRAGYEIVQKSISAGIGVLAAVGAPSSLAVALAREFNQTLVGFLKGDRFNVYSAPERLSPN